MVDRSDENLTRDFSNALCVVLLSADAVLDSLRAGRGDAEAGAEEVRGAAARMAALAFQLFSAEAASSGGRPRSITRTAGDETVLLVEGDAALRRVTAQCLRRNGYQVFSAADRLEALEVTSTIPGVVDVILTDDVVPELTGSERIGALGGHLAVARAKILVLRKPYDSVTLLGKIREALDAPPVSSVAASGM